jgi:hypothetical protein
MVSIVVRARAEKLADWRSLGDLPETDLGARETSGRAWGSGMGPDEVCECEGGCGRGGWWVVEKVEDCCC